MDRESSFKYLGTKLSALKELMGFCVALAAVFILVGTMWGCDDDGGSGTGRVPLHAFHLCDHSEEALQDLQQVMDIEEHNQTDHYNIILDGRNLESCTQQEITLIQEAFDNGFIILAYEMNEAQIAFLYKEILNHPLLYDEFEQVNIPPGEEFSVYTIENHDGHHWTSQIHFGDEEITITEPLSGETRTASLQTRQESTSGYTKHGRHSVDWIEAHDERLAELIDDGIIGGSATQVLNNFEMLDDFEGLVGETRAAQTSGTLFNLAQAWIQTNFAKISVQADGTLHNTGFDPNAPHINQYQLTTKAWVATNDTPSGLFSYLFVSQDFTLQNVNGYTRTNPNIQDDPPPGNGGSLSWFLASFKNINTLKVGSTDLDSSSAVLDGGATPGTNQGCTTSTTTSVSFGLNGDVGFDSSGGGGSVGGGVSWTSSSTFTCQNVSINNQSLSDSTLSNDASWQYLPRRSVAGGSSGLCLDFTLQNLADLSHQTFQPSQAFIYQIDGSFADQTVTLKTQIETIMGNDYLCGCNGFLCSCEVCQFDAIVDSATKTFLQNIHIPAAPVSSP